MLRLTFASGDRPAGLDAGREVNAWRSENGCVFAKLFAGAGRKWIDWPGVGLFVFSTGASSVEVWADPGVDRDAVADAFVRAIEPSVLQAQGWQALHAGAALVDGASLVFCGRSGSGKSTLAYAFGRAGFTQFADDAVVIQLGPQILAHVLPFSPRLRPPSATHLRPKATGHRPKKNAARPSKSPGPFVLPACVPVRAFFLLSQDLARPGPQIERIVALEAFSRLLAHAHCFDPGDPVEARRLTDDYMRLVEVVPVFAASYPPGLHGLDGLIEAVMTATQGDDRRSVALASNV